MAAFLTSNGFGFSSERRLDMHANCFSWPRVIVTTFLLFAALTGCGGSSKGLSDYIARVGANLSSGSPVTATQRAGKPSTGSGPTVLASSGGVTIAGGSKLIQLSSASSYSNVVVSVEGVDGYFELSGLTLDGGNATTIVVTIGQNAPQTFNLDLFAGTGTTYGTPQVVPVQLTNVGTGEVQVNVSWDVDSDVDLHVVEAGTNTEIYYGNKGPTPSGGQLDLDSNAGCSIDGKRSENITWPTGRAPRGTYIVRVDYWSDCGQIRTNYVVTVNVKGQQPQVFTGFFVATDADAGGAGAGRQITTFNY
jgi:hypothetical protein